MKITFFSNFLNHHQLPLCLEFTKLIGTGFYYVATEPMHMERKGMGYEDMNAAYPFVIRSYESEYRYETALTLALESDIVIIGSAPERFIVERLKKNKLTFRYSERIFKKGRIRILSPCVLKYLLWNNLRFKNRDFYLLCASAYTAGDFSIVNAFKNKAYKWGYFPKVIKYDLAELMRKKKKSTTTLIWAGRFLEWKHPEMALIAAHRLRNKGMDFHLKMIGGGPMEHQLKHFAASYGLHAHVEFKGFMTPQAVRSEMESAEIYLFTSDFNEGWGAVLNEAMNSACAVVASDAAGSVPFLIKHGENGTIYRSGSMDCLYENVLSLIENQELRYQQGINAYWTVVQQWNAGVAAERLLLLAESLAAGKDPRTLFPEGPCSFHNS